MTRGQRSGIKRDMSGGTSLTSGHSQSVLSVPLQCPSDGLRGQSVQGEEEGGRQGRWEGGHKPGTYWTVYSNF